MVPVLTINPLALTLSSDVLVIVSTPVSFNVPESFPQTTYSVMLMAYVPTNPSALSSVVLFPFSLEQDNKISDVRIADEVNLKMLLNVVIVYDLYWLLNVLYSVIYNKFRVPNLVIWD